MRCIYGEGSLWGFVKFSIASVENILNLMFSWDFFGLFESLVVILLSHPRSIGSSVVADGGWFFGFGHIWHLLGLNV